MLTSGPESAPKPAVSGGADDGDRYVSTGHLPAPGRLRAAVDEAYRMYRAEAGGENSRTYPALARVPGHLFGICVAGVSGVRYRAGDTGYEFTIMSVAKPFVFALVCELLGTEQVRRRLGVNATGLAFDSLAAVERSADGRSNPMVNAGAIAATSLAPGASPAAKWLFISEGLGRFAGRDLTVSDEVYASASRTNHRNRAIASLLFDVGVPGKSGIGGGIVVVSPGKGALGTFSPLLDRAGNSVRGQLAARHLSGTLGLSLFASEERRHG
jgi:glutaminase